PPNCDDGYTCTFRSHEFLLLSISAMRCAPRSRDSPGLAECAIFMVKPAAEATANPAKPMAAATTFKPFNMVVFMLVSWLCNLSNRLLDIETIREKVSDNVQRQRRVIVLTMLGSRFILLNEAQSHIDASFLCCIKRML